LSGRNYARTTMRRVSEDQFAPPGSTFVFHADTSGGTKYCYQVGRTRAARCRRRPISKTLTPVRRCAKTRPRASSRSHLLGSPSHSLGGASLWKLRVRHKIRLLRSSHLAGTLRRVRRSRRRLRPIGPGARVEGSQSRGEGRHATGGTRTWQRCCLVALITKAHVWTWARSLRPRYA